MLPLSGRDATPDNRSVKTDGLPDIIIRDGRDYATEEDSPSHYPQSKKGAHISTPLPMRERRKRRGRQALFEDSRAIAFTFAKGSRSCVLAIALLCTVAGAFFLSFDNIC